VGHPGGSKVRTDKDIHAVVIVPEVPDLHPVQVGRLAEEAKDLSADPGIPLRGLLVFLGNGLLLILFGHCHHSFQIGSKGVLAHDGKAPGL
jgi:hypothetical protein